MWPELNVTDAKHYNTSDMPRILELVQQGAVNLGQVVSHHFKPIRY